MTAPTTNWKGIAFYAILATLFSGIYRLGYFDFLFNPEMNTITRMAIVIVVVGAGPALAAVLSWKFFGRQNRSFTLLGTWPVGAVIIASLPAVVFAIFGCPNDFGMNPHLAGGLIGGLLFLYAMGEETGWRGYMHDALSPRPFWVRSLIIAPVWFMWHLWFVKEQPSLQDMVIGLAIISIAAFFLSWLISESRSLIASAGFHYVGNIGFMSNIDGIEPQQRLIIAGTAFVLMVVTHHFWKQKLIKVELS